MAGSFDRNPKKYNETKIYNSKHKRFTVNMCLDDRTMPLCCSYVEESNADKAIKALTAALAPKARVKRNGKVESIEAKELVPGDIVIIQFGNIVPADVKLLGKGGSDEVPMQVCGSASPHASEAVVIGMLCRHWLHVCVDLCTQWGVTSTLSGRQEVADL